MYQLVNLGTIKKKKTQKKTSLKKQNLEEKPKKISAYQLFNLVVKEEREKHKNFQFSGQERMQKWKMIQQLLSQGDIKATKKDFRRAIKH